MKIRGLRAPLFYCLFAAASWLSLYDEKNLVKQIDRGDDEEVKIM
jgi:hypothetical protein